MEEWVKLYTFGINHRKLLWSLFGMNHCEFHLMVTSRVIHSKGKRLRISNLVWVFFLIKRQNGARNVTWFLFGKIPDVPEFKVRVFTYDLYFELVQMNISSRDSNSKFAHHFINFYCFTNFVRNINFSIDGFSLVYEL